MTDELLTINDIAALYKVKRERARDSIVKLPGFPDIAPGTTWKQPRWVAAEVRAFIRRRSPQTSPNVLEAA
jgi:hypothetical protein